MKSYTVFISKDILLVAVIAALVLLVSNSVVFSKEPQQETTEPVKVKVFKIFDFKQKFFLAAATAIKPESAQKANVKYYYPVTDERLRQNIRHSKDAQATSEIALALENGEFVVIDAEKSLMSIDDLKKLTKKRVKSFGLVSTQREMEGTKSQDVIINWGEEKVVNLARSL